MNPFIECTHIASTIITSSESLCPASGTHIHQPVWARLHCCPGAAGHNLCVSLHPQGRAVNYGEGLSHFRTSIYHQEGTGKRNTICYAFKKTLAHKNGLPQLPFKVNTLIHTKWNYAMMWTLSSLLQLCNQLEVYLYDIQEPLLPSPPTRSTWTHYIMHQCCGCMIRGRLITLGLSSALWSLFSDALERRESL